jgi:hypothetical protein
VLREEGNDVVLAITGARLTEAYEIRAIADKTYTY